MKWMTQIEVSFSSCGTEMKIFRRSTLTSLVQNSMEWIRRACLFDSLLLHAWACNPSNSWAISQNSCQQISSWNYCSCQSVNFFFTKSVIHTEISGIQIHVPVVCPPVPLENMALDQAFLKFFPFVFDACSCHVEQKRCNTWNEFAVETDSSLKSVLQLPMTVAWPRGLMDKAPASGAGDCGFESRRGRYFAHIETFFFIPTVGLQFISAKCPW